MPDCPPGTGARPDQESAMDVDVRAYTSYLRAQTESEHVQNAREGEKSGIDVSGDTSRLKTERVKETVRKKTRERRLLSQRGRDHQNIDHLRPSHGIL